MQDDKNNKKKDAEGEYMLIGMSVGMCLGMSFGMIFFDDMSMGMAIGMTLGMSIGLALDNLKKKDNVKTVIIKKMKEEDIPFVVSCLDNTSEEFMQQWGGGRWYKYPVTIQQITEQFNTRNENTEYFIINGEGAKIGSVELDFINWEEKECTVCRFLIREEFRSKGYGVKALNELLEYAFHTLNMKKVKLTVFEFNGGALNCYQKAGFVESYRETRDNGWIAIHMEVNCK